MSYVGKVNLEEEAPNHPFSQGGSIAFVPKQQTDSSSTSNSTKPEPDKEVSNDNDDT